MANDAHDDEMGPLRPEFIDGGGGGPRIDASARRGAGGALVGLCVLPVLEGAVLDVDRLAPDHGGGFFVSAATMVRHRGGWTAHSWWRCGLTLGLLPVGLEASSVVEVWRPVSRQRWWQRLRRPVRWYWLLLGADDDSATFWGPFASPDELAGRRPPQFGG
jgi:hypothetical protein